MSYSLDRRAGMATPLIVTVLLVGAALAGAVLYQSQHRAPDVMPSDSPEPKTTITGPDITSFQECADAGNPVMESYPRQCRTEDGRTFTEVIDGTERASDRGFVPSGEIIAGTASPLIEFNVPDYDRALAEGKTILLYFYANWCPICRVEFTDTQGAFKELSNPDVVGFRVNYSDDETDDNEESLARQFGIAYQHTKVILVDGTPVIKDGSTWDRDRYLQELAKVTTN